MGFDEGSFEGCELRHIGRESNEEADKLANIGATKAPVPPGVFFERIEHRSIKKKRATPASAAPAKSKTPSTECRGFATSDVMDDFICVGLRESNVSELKIAGHEEDNVFYPGSAPPCEVKTYVLPILDWY